MGMFSFVGDLWNDITGASQMQANSQGFSRELAQFARENAQNRYQWAVEDMQKAGLNPAMMYSNGGSWAGSPASVPSAGSTVGGGTAAMGSLLGFLGNLAYGKASGSFDKIKAETEATQMTSAASARQMDAQAARASAEAAMAREDARVYAELPKEFRNFTGMMRLVPGSTISQILGLGLGGYNQSVNAGIPALVDVLMNRRGAQDSNSGKTQLQRNNQASEAIDRLLKTGKEEDKKKAWELLKSMKFTQHY